MVSYLEQQGVRTSIWEQNPQPQQLKCMPNAGRFSYVFIDPTPLDTQSPSTDPFTLIEQHLATTQNWLPAASLLNFFDKAPPPFLGGFLCLIGYEAARALERIKGVEAHPTLPELLLLKIDSFIVWDSTTTTAHLVHWPLGREGLQSNWTKLLTEMPDSEPSTAPTLNLKDMDFNLENTRLKKSRKEFISMVEQAKEYIAAGDIFQVVLSNSYSSPEVISAIDFYNALCTLNPSPYQFLVSTPEYSLVGSSPELMLYVEPPLAGESKISMRLVAGTYPREASSGVPDMCADPKEHAEHVMLVDHVRNDIGRVAKIGSVTVEDLCAIETYKDVHHLVSQVSGILTETTSSIDALRATFPIATLTGTPKIRAMEIIAELEKSPRGFFGGAVALLGYNGFLESSVIIRSALLHSQGIEIQAGAGIVHDSQPSREFDECNWKASALLQLCHKNFVTQKECSVSNN